MSFTWLAQHARNVYSQFGEDGLIAAVFDVIRPANHWCLEIGAADGIFFSNTRRLYRAGWNALLVEADDARFKWLTMNCAELDKCRLMHATLDELDPALARVGAPEDIDLAVIDVDGQDYFLLNSLLKYRPRVVLVEFNPNVDPDFIPDHGGRGQAGINAMIALATGKFYTVVARTWCNLLLVSQPLDQLLDRP